MALQRDTYYPGRYSTGNAAHPQGAFKNRTTPTSQDGSYLEKDWLNDWDGFFASLLSKANLTPDGNVDAVGASQYFTALQAVANGNYVTAGGTANVITLADTSVKSYVDGMSLRFKVSLANTGETTLNVNDVGAKTVYGSAGLACQGGELAPGLATVVYSTALTGFVIVHCTGGAKQVPDATQSHHAVSKSQLDAYSPPSATDTIAGIVRRATNAEEVAGASDVGFLTPAGLRTALNAAGSAPVYAVRAMARVVGATGVVTEGHNMSVTRTATGQYTVTFLTAMSTANYKVIVTVNHSTVEAGREGIGMTTGTPTVNGFTCLVADTSSNGATDYLSIYITVIGI